MGSRPVPLPIGSGRRRRRTPDTAGGCGVCERSPIERRIHASRLREHKQGRSLREIARALNADGVPCALQGKQWHPATMRAVVKRLERV